MNEFESITIVTSENSILRYLNSISEQNLPLQLSFQDEGKLEKKYQSSILKIDSENKQLILHQVLPRDWQQYIQPHQEIEIISNMPQGTIKFKAELSPLDDSGEAMYCRLSLPDELSKKQLRDSFRVSLSKFNSSSSLQISEQNKLVGSCKDLSLNGALFYLPNGHQHLKQGKLIEQCNLAIDNILELSCSARVCHISNIAENSMLVGLNFLDMEKSQRKAIRPAMNKLERLNITR